MRPNGPLILLAATLAALWLIGLGLTAAGLDTEGAVTLATGVALFVFGGLLNRLLGPLARRSPIASPQRQPLLVAATVIAVAFLLATALAPALVPLLWMAVLAPVGFAAATWTEADDRRRQAVAAAGRPERQGARSGRPRTRQRKR